MAPKEGHPEWCLYDRSENSVVDRFPTRQAAEDFAAEQCISFDLSGVAAAKKPAAPSRQERAERNHAERARVFESDRNSTIVNLPANFEPEIAEMVRRQEWFLSAPIEEFQRMEQLYRSDLI